MVTEELMQAMNISAADFPSELSEVTAAGLHTTPSEKLSTPRLVESPVNLECRLHSTIDVGSNKLFIGEVVMFHIADHLVSERLHINGFTPIGRLGSPSAYCRTADRFELPRISYQQHLSSRDGQS
jgi:flavin reductase (DIM6/NTAB) family NADH-FMN oxidoreductase RutF